MEAIAKRVHPVAQDFPSGQGAFRFSTAVFNAQPHLYLAMEIGLSTQEWEILKQIGLVWGIYQTCHTLWELAEKIQARRSREPQQTSNNDGAPTARTEANGAHR